MDNEIVAKTVCYTSGYYQFVLDYVRNKRPVVLLRNLQIEETSLHTNPFCGKSIDRAIFFARN